MYSRISRMMLSKIHMPSNLELRFSKREIDCCIRAYPILFSHLTFCIVFTYFKFAVISCSVTGNGQKPVVNGDISEQHS